MDYEQEFQSLRSKIEHIEKLINIDHDIVMSACNEINVIHRRVDGLVETGNGNLTYTRKQIRTIQEMIDNLGQKFYLTYYKVFPELIDADNALRRATKNAGSDPKDTT